MLSHIKTQLACCVQRGPQVGAVIVEKAVQILAAKAAGNRLNRKSKTEA